MLSIQSVPGPTTLPYGEGTYECSDDAKGDGGDGLCGGRCYWWSHVWSAVLA